MSKWTHNICVPCWKLMNGEREPVSMKPEFRKVEKCCFCGKDTESGIVVRHDPKELRCEGIHES